MKRMIIVFTACVLLVGCDYNVPLVKTADIPIDAALLSLWQRPGDDNKIESLLVLPFNKHEYLIVFPSGEENAMFARGCLWRNENTTLVQLDWFGTARGEFPENKRTFQYAAYTIETDKLSVRLLNPDVVLRDIASSDELAKAIAANKDDPKFFREKMVFQRVKN